MSSELQPDLDLTRTPNHIAIIMDGNGRWARERGLPRIMGHRAGTEAARRVLQACPELQVRELTMYTFSAENWRRPQEEVELLMALINEKLRDEADELHRQGIRVRVIGRRGELSPELQATISELEALTMGDTTLRLNLAINYGGRTEIVDACRALSAEVKEGRAVPDEINEETFAQHLYQPDMSEPDLLVRTAGELRVSNYLLWQIAYAEIWVTPVLWPDFQREHLVDAIADYQRRQRKFGGLE